jgi:hypothetical protein
MKPSIYLRNEDNHRDLPSIGALISHGHDKYYYMCSMPLPNHSSFGSGGITKPPTSHWCVTTPQKAHT